MIALLLALELIARVLAGEAGPMGPEAMVLVASTAQQRLEAGGYGETLQAVIDDGYNGNAPATSRSIAIAWALVTGRVPAVGLLFAYSAEDMARHGWRTGQLVVRGHNLELHLSKLLPWEGTNGD